MKSIFNKLQLICWLIIITVSLVYKIDPQSKRAFQIIDFKIGENIFNSYFFDAVYQTKSLANQYEFVRFYYDDKQIQIRKATSSVHHILVGVSKYPKSCVSVLDQQQWKINTYIVINQNASQTIAKQISMTFNEFEEIFFSADCLTFKWQDDIYSQNLYNYSFSALTDQEYYINKNFNFKMDKYGFTAIYSSNLQETVYMDLFSNNEIECFENRCVALSYQPGQILPFKLIILQRYVNSQLGTSKWKIKLQYDDWSVIIPSINVNNNFNNILFTYQRSDQPFSVRNIQYNRQNDGEQVIYLAEQRNGINRQVILSEYNFLYINRTLDQKGLIRFTVYSREISTRLVDYLIDAKNMQKYNFSVIQENQNNSFNRILNVFQNNSILYWCSEYSYKACLNILSNEDNIVNVLEAQKIQTSSSKISDTLLIISISIPSFIVLLLIVLIILAKCYIIGCPDCCWTSFWVKFLQFFGIHEYYESYDDETNESLQSYLDKLQQQKKMKQVQQVQQV